SLHWTAVKIGAVLDKLDDVENGLARGRANECEENLRREAMATIENREAHGESLRLRALRLRVPPRIAAWAGRPRRRPRVRASGLGSSRTSERPRYHCQ